MDSAHTVPDEPCEAEQPGLRKLREAVANTGEKGVRANLIKDGFAGLYNAISNIPDGLAAGILVGVNPVYGLYASITGPIAGGLLASTQLSMMVTTSASALATGRALSGFSGEARDRALFAMVIVIGVFQILFSLLKLAKLVRFVSYSVMTSFLSGIATLTVLSQLPTITGYQPPGGSQLIQAANLLANFGQIHFQSLALAILTLVLAVLLPRTRLGNLGMFVAIVLPSLIAFLFHWASVQIVRDVGEIPRGLPALYLPSLSDLPPQMLTTALGIAIIIIVQGAGVSQSVPNPDDSRRSTSHDILATGIANIVTGFFRGLPVGGSISATMFNVVVGAASRWAAVFAGLWLILIMFLFAGIVSYVIMPSLGALLIYASVSAIKPDELLSIWESGWPARLAGGATLAATLVLPIEVAVGIGVVLSASLYLSESSGDITLVQVVRKPDGQIEERKPLKQLQSNQVTVLDEYGPLYYASARTLERLLPAPEGTQNPVVVLRLRGATNIGATLMDVLADYATRLQEVGGQLYLSGIGEEVQDLLAHSNKLRLSGPVQVYSATPIVGQSTRQAVADARAWLVKQNQPEDPTHISEPAVDDDPSADHSQGG